MTKLLLEDNRCRELNIGIADYTYPSERNIRSVVPGYNYRKAYNFYRVLKRGANLNKRYLKLPFKKLRDVNNGFYDLDLTRVDILHLFNAISLGTTPWITTFETVVPRYDSALACHGGETPDYSPLVGNPCVMRALESMSHASCKQLIALSECNLRMQQELLAQFPAFQSAIEPKLTQIHPPQKLLLAANEQKSLDTKGPIHFMFVGKSFDRKGGFEILDAFQEARRAGYNMKLTLVSSMSLERNTPQAVVAKNEAARQCITRCSDWIDHYESLPNSEVLRLMKSAHVGLLPTHADTYGYSVLEFQAAGCPVISTNVRALPEINNQAAGWLIDVPKNRLGEALSETEADRELLSQKIRSGLKNVITEIMEEPEKVREKSAAALARIREYHDPDDYALKLETIYRRALQ